MPKYYCDYCDVFLTHDSPSVRKTHNDGGKHKAAVRAYYAQFEHDLTQSLIQQKLKEFQEGKAPGFPGQMPGAPLVINPHAPPMMGGPGMMRPPGMPPMMPPGAPPMMPPGMPPPGMMPPGMPPGMPPPGMMPPGMPPFPFPGAPGAFPPGASAPPGSGEESGAQPGQKRTYEDSQGGGAHPSGAAPPGVPSGGGYPGGHPGEEDQTKRRRLDDDQS